jgi:hypothetical protein
MKSQRKEASVKLMYCLGVCFLAALSACARFRVGTEFASGRQALIEGKYENALAHSSLDTLRRKD